MANSKLGLSISLFVFVILCVGCRSPITVQENEPANNIADQIPGDYRNLNNPLQANPKTTQAGKELYLSNCKSCHGETGKGDGIAGVALNPKPPDFSERGRQALYPDSYYYWRIAEGGNTEQFNSAMPGWKGILEPKEIWQLIIFLRSLY